jgi:hypothetical protein
MDAASASSSLGVRRSASSATLGAQPMRGAAAGGSVVVGGSSGGGAGGGGGGKGCGSSVVSGGSLLLDYPAFDHTSAKNAHQRAQYMLGLGSALLEPLNAIEAVSSVRIARPASDVADRQRAATRSSRPRDALAHEDKWSASWQRREERVANSLRRHVVLMRSRSGIEGSKSALVARRMAQSRLMR